MTMSGIRSNSHKRLNGSSREFGDKEFFTLADEIFKTIPENIHSYRRIGRGCTCRPSS